MLNFPSQNHYLYLQGIDTSKVLLKIPENIKLPEGKDGAPVKVKIMTAAQAQQQGILVKHLIA